MAKKAQGILSKPQKTPAELKARKEAEAANRAAKKAGQGGLKGLNPNQQQMIQGQEQQDLALQGQAGAMLPSIQQSMSQPFDWSQLPTGPVQGDFNNWRQQQIDATNNEFSSRMDPVFKQQEDDLAQQLYNQGNAPGSPKYEQQMKALRESQNAARSSNLVQAQQLAGQNAGQFFDIGTQARGNALSEGLMARNMPLNDYNALRGSQSGMMMQNLGYGQGLSLQNDDQANQRWMMQHAPRGGGGGGVDPYKGFGSYQGLAGFEDARQRANAEYQMQLQQQYAPKQPSYGAQLGGSLLGIGAGLLGGYAGSNWF